MNSEYAAGLFDGEGSVCIALEERTRTSGVVFPCHQLGCSVSSTYKPILSQLKSVWGGTVALLYGKDSRHKDTWFWGVSNKCAEYFLSSIRQYSLIKRPLVETAIAFRKGKGPSNRTTPDELVEREVYRQTMWALNGLASNAKDIGNRRIPLDELKKHRIYAEASKLVESTKTKINKTRISLLYLAGLFDGEGNAGIYKSEKIRGERVRWNYHFSINIYSTNELVLRAVQRCFGGYVKKGTNKSNGKHNTVWSWVRHGDDAREILTSIRPHLIIKADQADLGLLYLKNKKFYKYPPFEEEYKRECFRQAFWRLNGTSSRGPSHNKHRTIPYVDPTEAIFQWVDNRLSLQQ